MMKIRLGVGLDLDVIDNERPSFGEVVVGLNGMLSLLESQLGLAGSGESLTTRLVQYHHCLKANLSGVPFYHDSFQTDSFASTKELLRWRDELYLSGWTGQFMSDVSPRLRDIAIVEKQAQGFVALGEGERLQQVIKRLVDQRVQISEIELLDALELLPPLWQQVLKTLRDNHAISIREAAPLQNCCEDKTDLGLVQSALLDCSGSSNDSKEKAKLSGDSSVLIVKAGARAFSASAIAKLLHHAYKKDESGSFCLLAEQNGASLDAALEHEGLLRLGFQANSPWRPSFQVLPLCFELLWQPLDPHILLQFLNHPVGPIPRRIRKKLSPIVSSQPGIGGESWQNKVDALVEEEAESDPKRAAKLKEQIDFWLHSERYAPETGIPVDVAINLAEKLSQWLSGMQSNYEGQPEASLYIAALHQAQELGIVLRELESGGMGEIDRVSLRHLIEDLRGTGIGLVDRIPEVGNGYPSIEKSEAAGAILSARETIIWWDCHRRGGVSNSHWLPIEKRALEEEGIGLWAEKNQLLLQGSAWIRPILCAKKQLIFVLHEESGAHHPILDNIESLVDGVPVVSLEEGLITNKPVAMGGQVLPISEEPVGHLPLPLISRWWQLPVECTLPNRQTESYSSLDGFINSPYQWVLKYQARLRSSPISTVSDQNLLKGSLSHRLFELFFCEFKEPLNIDLKSSVVWTKDKLMLLLEQEGAVLLMPGRLAERERFVNDTLNALEALVQMLQEAGIKNIEMESWQEGKFVGGKLNGSIDLLVTNSDEHEAVVDIKWGGYKYRRSTLEDDKYLQLATYAKLRKGKSGRWPVLAYFIIQDARMLSNDTDYFPSADLVMPKSSENVAAFWQRVESSWKWRRNQLDEGWVEVTVKNTEPTERSQQKEDEGIPIPDSSDNFNDFAVLTGWREES